MIDRAAWEQGQIDHEVRRATIRELRERIEQCRELADFQSWFVSVCRKTPVVGGSIRFADAETGSWSRRSDLNR